MTRLIAPLAALTLLATTALASAPAAAFPPPPPRRTFPAPPPPSVFPGPHPKSAFPGPSIGPNNRYWSQWGARPAPEVHRGFHPRRQAFWIPDQWAWNGWRWVWVPGHWE